ncbi:hypothetical protein H312_03348 [Anncaliia algerae PRA339]|uniref:Uncharacterized protein n=1 Tax=Anncaliia algerae PRA339 TaxID=1288291 RepID=A0A059EW48_9MICR|nr:hypothetical protein H312_03348 [Anncaliia algerae PRA339]
MKNKLKQTIDLIKKTKNNPIIFHLLYSNLCNLKKTERTFIQNTNNLFTNILYASTDDPRTTNQSLENKILTYLKESRNNYNILKLRIILYYLDGRLLSKLNTFILFEIMNHHFGMNYYNDALIEQILSKHITSNLFGIKNVKKIHNEAIEIFLQSQKLFSLRRLPMYITSNMLPPVVHYDNQKNSEYLNLKVAESLSFYAKYTKNIEYFKQIVPQTDDFLVMFKSFISNTFNTVEDRKSFSISNLVSDMNEEMNSLFYRIKNAIDKVKDKQKIKNELIDYIETL